MKRCSTEPRDQTFVKGYEFLFFIGNAGKHFCGKYSHKLFDYAKRPITDEFKLLQKEGNLKIKKSNW